MTTKLSRQSASDAAPEWRFLLQRLHLTVRAPDAGAALALVARAGEVGIEHGRALDVDVRGSVVHFALSSPDVDGVTAADTELCHALDRVVDELGLTREPGDLTSLEVAIDALDIDAVRPFWEAVLGYVAVARNDLRDPQRISPAFWFQQMDEPRPQRNRIHIDVTVPHDEAHGRIERALAAGGRLVNDEEAPAFWVLADPEGNEACICTWQGRDPAPE